MSSEYYAIQWFLTLFASDLPQPIVRRIWDRFLVAGWRVMAQVGLVLLYRIQDALLEMDLILVFSQSQEKNIEVQCNTVVFIFFCSTCHCDQCNSIFSTNVSRKSEETVPFRTLRTPAER